MAFAGVCLLAAIAPFEWLQPLVVLPWQKVTTVEAAIGLALAGWFVAVIATGERPRWRSPVVPPWAAWLVVGAVSALLAPAFHFNALKTTARLAGGLVVFLLAMNAVTTERRLRTMMALALSSGVIVASLATLEYAGVPTVMHWLNAFRNGVYVVGGHVRASGTLQYPTIASMYLELMFALGVGLWLAAVDTRSIWGAAIFIGLVVVAEGIVVTLTRAGLVSLGVVLGVAGGHRWFRCGFDRGVAGLAALAAMTGLLMVSSASAESLRLRLTTEGQRDWYHAAFLTPGTLTFRTASLNTVDVTVINQGRVTWHPDAAPPFHVSYHWFDEARQRVVSYEGLRTPLPRAVAPGEPIAISMEVRAPREAGVYTLSWDVVQEGRLWFSTEPGSRLALSRVTVTGEPAGSVMPPAPRRAVPPQAVRLGRLALWKAALGLAKAHPLLGLGPDNFRLTYGGALGLANADERVTSNNMYLEVLTGTGLIGLVIFAWLCWRAGGLLHHAAAVLTGPARSLYAGVAAATVVIGVHGLVDSFLTLTPTYLAIALTLGVSAAPCAWGEAHGAVGERTFARDRADRPQASQPGKEPHAHSV